MKKLLSAFCAVMILMLSSACGDWQTPNSSANLPDPTQTAEDTLSEKPEETVSSDITDTPGKHSFEEVDATVQKDIEDTIGALRAQYDKLTADIDTYDKYLNSTAQVEAFYNTVYTETQRLCIRMREYSINYARLVLDSGKSNDDMYDDAEIIYDNIYDDAGEEIYDEIYDGILEDIYDAFYDGILDDAYDGASYKEWSDARSDEYGWWSDARSDVYKKWSDFRSDVYSFYSDMRSDLYGNDIEGVEKEIQKFQEDINKLKEKSDRDSQENPTNTGSTDSFSEPPETSAPTTGIRPEFKEAMDSYEAFFNEYVEFMTRFANSNNALAMMGEYTSFMSRYTEAMTAMGNINDGTLSNEELAYYTEVQARITAKLLTVAQ